MKRYIAALCASDERPMHVCLISPGHLSANPRLVKEARALKSAGLEVSVVCGSYLPWGVEADRALALELGNVTAVPFGPSALDRAGYLRTTILRHLARNLVRAGLRNAMLETWAQHPAAGGLRRAAEAIAADLYIAHYVAALPAAASAARLHGSRYAFDAEDFHFGDLPDVPQNAFERNLIRSLEGRLLPRCAFITAASPLIAEAYAGTYGITAPTTVLNVFARCAAPAAPTRQGSKKPGPSVYWFSQVVGPGRGLETLIDATAQAKRRPHLYLRGTPANGYAHELRARAELMGIGGNLHLLDPVPPADLERDGAQFDLGYAGELTNSPNHERALSNKLFSYLSSGIPVVMSNTPAQSSIAPELGVAAMTFTQGDAGALANAIDSMLAPNRLAQARRSAWELGQAQFAWENEAPKLVRLVMACR